MNGIRIIESGTSGPRVLLLPGLGARGTGYRPLARLLEPSARVVIVEYPRGRAAAAGAGRLAEQIIAAAGEVDAVVASSFGGLVATHLASRRKTRGVAYVGSFASLEHIGIRGALIPVMGPIATLGRPGMLAAAIAARRLIPRPSMPDIVPTTSEERWSVLHRALAIPREPAPPSLRGSGLSCVVIHGDSDLLVPVGSVKRLLESLPEGTRGHVISGAGHVPYFTHAETVARILLPWLKAFDASG